MILKFLLSIQMICKMLKKILKSTMQIKPFDDLVTDMINNKKINSIVTELFIRDRKLNISLAFITNHVLKHQKMLD